VIPSNPTRRRASRLLALVCAAFSASAAPVRGEDAEAVTAREAIVAAIATKDDTKISKALTDARGLVGPGKTFPTNAELAGWLGELPESVTGLPIVKTERAWLYISGRKGAEAIPLLLSMLPPGTENALLRSYLGEARRQGGDPAGAVMEWVAALQAGATDEQVMPSVRRLLYDVHETRGSDPKGVPPVYATVAAPIFQMRPSPDVAESLADWLAADVEMWKGDPARVEILRAEEYRQFLVAAKGPWREGSDEARLALARKAYDAGIEWREGKAPIAGADKPDAPTLFDLFAAAVRLGETGTEGHGIPEALTALAEQAAAKGRYVLAGRLCRRRLSISDSPAARKILVTLPPDVGD
jgi:hypothetical protein